MAELTDVLGTILKDLTHSRVISDIFSRDASVEYERDEILGAFPVPRLEIKEASVDLKFAVNSVQRKEVDRNVITRVQISTQAPRLGQQIYDDFLARSPDREKLLGVIRTRRLRLREGVAQAIQEVVTNSPDEVAAALDGQPQALVGKVSSEVAARLLADSEVDRLVTGGQDARRRIVAAQITRKTTDAVKTFTESLKTAIADAEEQSLGVDIAVTKEELADVPETMVSRINVVTEIRNYEWTEVGEVDGQPVRRLKPE